MKNICFIILIFLSIHSTGQTGGVLKNISAQSEGKEGLEIGIINSITTNHTHPSKPIYGSTSSSLKNVNTILKNIHAHFVQPKDSIQFPLINNRIFYSFYTKQKDTSMFFSIDLRNEFLQKKGIAINMTIVPFGYTGHFEYGANTQYLLNNPSLNASQRDSIKNTEYLRFINSRKTRISTFNKGCILPSETIEALDGFDTNVFNADSTILLKWIARYPFSPKNATGSICPFALQKELVLFKKNIGYILFRYYLFNIDLFKNYTIGEVSRTLDDCIEKTWGMVQFDNDN